MKLTCPVNKCRADNNMQAEVCIRCGTPLHGYARLSAYQAQLFNQGLLEAQKGQFARARYLFAAVVYWCPTDIEARNALAMACYALNDLAEACHQWKTVLERSPTDRLATQSLAALANATSQAKLGLVIIREQSSKPHSKKRR